MEGEGGKQIYQTGKFMENCWSIGTQCNLEGSKEIRTHPGRLSVLFQDNWDHNYRVASREKGRMEP